MKTYKGKTKQGEKWYGDLGAMRFPGVEGQPIINKVTLTDRKSTSFFLQIEYRCSKNLIYQQPGLLILIREIRATTSLEINISSMTRFFWSSCNVYYV